MKTFTFACFLFPLCLSGFAAESASPSNIGFTIGAVGFARERSDYPVGKPIRISCVFRNISSQAVDLNLKDHDPYSGTLPYPAGLMARVTDASGKVVTFNQTDKNGWWTSFFLVSQVYRAEPGDVITIPPEGKVTRVVSLDEILSGCDCLPHGLPSGRFLVQLRIGVLESNPITITVAPAEGLQKYR